MSASPRIGCLVDETAGEEQATAYEWCDGRFDAVERCRPDAVEAGRYDVVWWHRADPVTATALPDSGAIEAVVRSGGSLLLTLGAMTAVEPMGFDGTGPDAVGYEMLQEPAGPLWKALRSDHPVVSGFEGLRVHTRGPDVTVPYARYETVAPTDGDVLASTVRGGDDAVAQMATVAWEPGDGQVLGIGSAVSFREPTADDCRRNREKLVGNALAFLADGEPAPLSGRPKTAATLSKMRARLAADRHRPGYHLTAPANWLNDPNGLVQWNGRYHVFYQYNPTGPYHNTIHWGHAVSDDLVHWRDEPVALSPSPEGPDRDGCWSGCAVDDDGTATILYTGGRGTEQLPCLATAADDELGSWVKDPANPIIDSVPAEPAVLRTEDWDGEFRDHCVWREGGEWHQLIGAGMAGGGGAALLYVSEDLREWTYRGPVLTGDHDIDGTVWECPELLDFGDRQLLHVSNYEDVVYFLGEYDDEQFTVDRRGKLDHGDFYAPQSMWTDDGRTLTWGWVPEARDQRAQWDAGWSGSLSVPRELTLSDDGGLCQRPAAELTELRGHREHVGTLALADGDSETLATESRQFELACTVRLADADAVELDVLATPDGAERTALGYTRDGEVVLDRSESSESPHATADSHRMAVPPYDEALSVRVFVDGSIVEVFANERHCLTGRVYPTREDATGIAVSATGGRATVEELNCWELGDVWE
jgi:beta-fructofuranosidase